jgi:hypothetical protein
VGEPAFSWGITRGKKLVVLIGQKKALGIAVRNTDRKVGIMGCSPGCEAMSSHSAADL